MACCAVPEACAGLTAEKLREDGIFLWTNGSEAILFFGQRVPPPLIHATIGASTAGHAMLTSWQPVRLPDERDQPGPHAGHLEGTLMAILKADHQQDGRKCISRLHC